MLLKKLLVFMSVAVLWVNSNVTVAQSDVNHVERCGQAFTTSEELKDEKFARSYFALQDAVERRSIQQFNSPKVIPVVIHVILGDNNINQDQIQTEFDYLNEQFELNNTNISFCLVDTRFYDEDEVNSWCGLPIYCYNAVQNEIGENTDDLMEVYIGSWPGGTLGFTALPPAGVGVWVKDTEVLDPDSKTLTHEAGHWCGLLHTFSANLSGGNYNCTSALTETFCETQGDRVCDTPPTAIDWSCQDACPDIDEVDESYMSYAPDGCQDLFTPGQVNRMHAQLELGRADAISNDICCDLGDCPWDFDGNGWININDFLEYLTWHARTGDCLPADFNYDGIVDINDLNIFLIHWMTECGTGDEIGDVYFSTKDLLTLLESDLVNITWYDVMGRRVYSEYGDLAPGFYIQVEEYFDGTKLTRKIAIR